MKRRLRAAAAIIAIGGSAGAAAQEHAGDVLPYLDPPRSASARIVLENPAPTEAGTGFRLLTGDFADFAGGPLKTGNPGFDTQDAAFIPGTLLGVRAVTTLEFWDGAQWVTAPAAATVTITDAVGGLTVISGSAITRPDALLGQFDAQGNLHEHVDYAASVGAPVGAYLLKLRLFGQVNPSAPPSSVYLDSEPFVLVLNRGMSAAGFQCAVDVRTGARADCDAAGGPAARVPVGPVAVIGLAALLAAIGVRRAARA